MARVVNDPATIREDIIAGFVSAYGRLVRRVPDAAGVMAVGAPQDGKVSVLIGGGSGHYPAFCGMVGPGMADVAVIGDIFASPSAEQVARCTRAVSGGAGVLYTYGNYAGDVMNFGMAEARCRAEGIEIRTVLVTDDVASAPPDQWEDRRGIAGDLFVFKAAGASAARGDALADVEALTRHANDWTRSFGVAFGGCTLPGQAEPLFTVDPGRMELGLGVHGEPGVSSSPLLPAREIAAMLVATILADAPPGVGSQAAVLLNSLGSTTYEELFVLHGDVDRCLREAGVEPYEPIVGELVTSLDMAGCSLTVMWLDADLRALRDAPATSAAFTQLGR